MQIGIAFSLSNRVARRVADSNSFCALFLRARVGSGQFKRQDGKLWRPELTLVALFAENPLWSCDSQRADSQTLCGPGGTGKEPRRNDDSEEGRGPRQRFDSL